MTLRDDKDGMGSDRRCPHSDPVGGAPMPETDDAEPTKAMTREDRARAIVAWAMRADRAFWNAVGRDRKPTAGGSKDD